MTAADVSMEEPYRRLVRFAPAAVTVLVLGESGSGKEAIARAVHALSARRSGPFVAVNVPAIPPALLESELFGHARGAFTGADRDRKGLLEEAERGTIFFDEIGDLTPPLQAKLLRALQEREIRRVGENRARKLDVRVVSASSRAPGAGGRGGPISGGPLLPAPRRGHHASAAARAGARRATARAALPVALRTRVRARRPDVRPGDSRGAFRPFLARQRSRASERGRAGGGPGGTRRGGRTGAPAGVPAAEQALGRNRQLSRARGPAPPGTDCRGAGAVRRQPQPGGAGPRPLAPGASVSDKRVERDHAAAQPPLNGSSSLTKRDKWQWAAVLIAACILTYANGLGGDFTYDDKAIVRDNPRIRSPGNVSQIFTTSYFGGPRGPGTVYRPVLLLSYAVQWWIHGRQAVAFHAVNVLLHAGATLLLGGALPAHRHPPRRGLRSGAALRGRPDPRRGRHEPRRPGGGSRRRLHPALSAPGASAFPPSLTARPRRACACHPVARAGPLRGAQRRRICLGVVEPEQILRFAQDDTEVSASSLPSRCSPGGTPLLRARGAHQGERIVGTGAGPSPFRLRRRGGIAGTPGTGLRPRASASSAARGRLSPASFSSGGGSSEDSSNRPGRGSSRWRTPCFHSTRSPGPSTPA